MRFFKELTAGFLAYFQAFRFIKQHRLWAYVLIPALLNVLIFAGFGAAVWQSSGRLSAWLIDLTGVGNLTGEAETIAGWLIGAIVKVISFFVYFKFFRYTILLLSAPALALIAEKTQEILTGVTHPFSFRQLLHDVLRGLGITLRNLLIELSLTIPLYLLALVPVITPFATVLILGIESYFVGFSMIDYRNEYHRLSARESRRFVNQRKGLAIGNGLAFNLLLFIPVLGVLVAPPLGAIAAALAVKREE